MDSFLHNWISLLFFDACEVMVRKKKTPERENKEENVIYV